VLVLIKFAAYGGVITWLSITGGGSWRGMTVRPCDPVACYRAPHPPIGSVWIYRNGKYQAAAYGHF
jgi:hypothetical protein